MKKRVHENSVAAYGQERQKLSERSRAVLGVLKATGRGMTDREVMAALGFNEPNSVRPRITELKDAGLIREAGKITCPTSRKAVRLVEAVAPEDANGQRRLL